MCQLSEWWGGLYSALEWALSCSSNEFTEELKRLRNTWLWKDLYYEEQKSMAQIEAVWDFNFFFLRVTGFQIWSQTWMYISLEWMQPSFCRGRLCHICKIPYILCCTNTKQLFDCGWNKLLLLYILNIKQRFHNAFFCLPEMGMHQNVWFICFNLTARKNLSYL